MLGLAQTLYGRAPPAAIVTIAGKDFAFGDGLSSEVREALGEARERARRIAESFGPCGPKDLVLSREP